MRSEIGSGPFRPGTGRPPPHLSGREEEQDLFRRLLDDLDEGRAPPCEVLLDGPPGNGKTALLEWVSEEAGASTGVEVETLTPAEFDSPGGLAESLLPASWWMTVRDFVLGPRTRSGGLDLARVLAYRAGRRPLVLLLDEAHTLDPKIGGSVLNDAHEVGRSAPFLLVLAGAPNLRDHLAGMGVSFWTCGRKFRIGRLDERAAAEAIRKPLETEDIAIADEALEHIFRESEGYPFFVQLWGEAVWARAAAETRREITSEDVRACQADFDRQRNDHYRRRCDELEELRLLRTARAVAEAFESRPVLSYGELEAAIRRVSGEAAGHDEVAAAEKELHRSGFLWMPGTMPVWEPGIPSLMAHILREVPAP